MVAIEIRNRFRKTTVYRFQRVFPRENLGKILTFRNLCRRMGLVETPWPSSGKARVGFHALGSA